MLRNLRDVTEFAREHTDEFYTRATENGEVEAEKYSRTAGNLIVIHYAFRLPEQDGLPVLESLM